MRVLMKDKDGVWCHRYINPKNFDPKTMTEVESRTLRLRYNKKKSE